ncbi:hypothetical protein M569_15334, partial [Genlisea aurea]
VISKWLLLFLLFGMFFYLGGIYRRCEGNTDEIQDFRRLNEDTGHFQIKPVVISECDLDFQDYTPCTDPKRWRKFSLYRLSFLERHCPPPFEKLECLVPPPDGYQLSIRWPKSRDECWYRNVPYDWINKQKSNQHWLKKEGEKFLFPGGGTMFPNGVSEYVTLMQDLIPEMKDGTVRTAIDTGCGVASWGGDLLNHGILTVSLAPRDNHEAQVQFALERGIPAMLGVISTQRLAFPSHSFDLAHCSRCLIPWTEFGGMYLFEIHRILRPGGFWALSGPPVNYEHRWRGWNTTIEEQRKDYENLQELLTSMCFDLYSKRDDIAVWKKSSDPSCYKKIGSPDSYPPKCDDGIEPDTAWYTPMRSCIVHPDNKYRKLALETLPKWPERLNAAPERLADVHGGSKGNFQVDSSTWRKRVEQYKSLIPSIGRNEIRNVMDMNTIYGGFAAALIDDPLWVMNVVSSYSQSTLAVVYDRGLIGTYHDWCEAFSTYPRTYDLLHLDGLFTAESHRCEMKHVMLEMDRILRPNGYALIRESDYFADAVTAVAAGMRWNCRRHDDAGDGDRKTKIIIVCRKKLWHSS